jgi:hypothetical protein
MTISSSLNASVAGLASNATRLAAISDNIANSATFGYKRAVTYQCTLTHSKTKLFGTSALVCFALSTPVVAYDFVITGSDNSTNGIGTTNGGTAAAIADTAIDGSDTVSLGIALTTTGTKKGIQTSGDANTITVSETGSITTTGISAWGISNLGHNSETTVSGSITTAGTSAYGIATFGDTDETTVSGSITTTGLSAYGIANLGYNNTTTVSGNITTAGNDAYGIYSIGSTNETTVSGSIVTAGNSAHGILINGYNNTTTISGSITSTGTASSALVNTSGSGGTFILDEGAVIIGDVTALAGATNNSLKFNLGASTSYAYSVGGRGAGTGAGQWTFTDQDGRAPIATTSGTGCLVVSNDVPVCNLVTAVGSGNAEAQDELQFSMNSSMIGSLEFGSSASGSVDATSFTDVVQNKAWANLYGESSKRASSTTQSSFDTSNRGLTIGTPLSISDTLDVDLVFNTSRTSLDIGLTKDQEITVNSYNLGAVVHDIAPASGWAVDAFGFVGRNAYDGKRKVMNNDTTTGSEIVTAAYSGMEVLVGVDAQYSNPINDKLNFIGGLNASLSNERIGAYSESKYYAWDARTLTQAIGGFTAGLEYHTDALKTFASLGAQRSSLQNGKTAGYTNNGTAGSYTEGSGNTYRTASVGFDYTGEGGMSFSGAIERFSSTGGVSGNSASLSANWSF